MKTSIYLDEDLHRWVKDHAHAEGISEAEVYRRSVKAFRELEESKAEGGYYSPLSTEQVEDAVVRWGGKPGKESSHG